MSRILTEQPSIVSTERRTPWRSLLAACTCAVVAVCCASCGGTKSRVAQQRAPSKSEASTLVVESSAFREEVSVRVPRAIAIEPKIGEGAAAAFAASLGRDMLAVEALRSVAPGVALMHDASILRVDDSPIPEQYEVDAPVDIGQRANPGSLAIPGHQRKRRYWRHYLRIEPADLGGDAWEAETGNDEVDETSAAARVVRTPGWRAVVARRELVAVDSVRTSGDSLIVVYRWHWVPTEVGTPFMSTDTLVADRVGVNNEAPLLTTTEHRDIASFVRTRVGWAPRRPAATAGATDSAAP